MAASPILFQPSKEQAPPDEARTIDARTGAMSAGTRAEKNGCPIHEPRAGGTRA